MIAVSRLLWGLAVRSCRDPVELGCVARLRPRNPSLDLAQPLLNASLSHLTFPLRHVQLWHPLPQLVSLHSRLQVAARCCQDLALHSLCPGARLLLSPPADCSCALLLLLQLIAWHRLGAQQHHPFPPDAAAGLHPGAVVLMRQAALPQRPLAAHLGGPRRAMTSCGARRTPAGCQTSRCRCASAAIQGVLIEQLLFLATNV